MMPFPAFSNRRGMWRLSEKAGQDWFRKYIRLILWSVRIVRGPCASSASSKTRKSSVTSSRIWGSGFSDQGRRRKSVSPHYPNPNLPIPTRILHINTPTVTPTPNTPGMIIYSHNVLWSFQESFKTCRIGLSEMQAKDIFGRWTDQKVSRFCKWWIRFVPPTRSAVSSTAFCG